ncbi:predicted protein [Nematostella vectensis]|uniref:ATP-dependent DNA helicase n=1 Tax=Nematostella vectensis TaxID=45351 RepID=A7S446_NEMVE|nr:predicted protein [Nematostella vectensis]|eukprot:XP_001633600.1 predicted protein [Nematostella vectensis]
MAAAEYNPAYADVTIDVERIENLPLDGDLVDIRTVEFAGKDEDGEPKKELWLPPVGTAEPVSEDSDPLVRMLLDVDAKQEAMLEDHLNLASRVGLHTCSDYFLCKPCHAEPGMQPGERICRMEFGSEYHRGKQRRENPDIVTDRNWADLLEVARDHPRVVRYSRYNLQSWRANCELCAIFSPPDNPSTDDIIATYVPMHAKKMSQQEQLKTASKTVNAVDSADKVSDHVMSVCSWYKFACKNGKVPVVSGGSAHATRQLQEYFCRTMMLLHWANWFSLDELKFADDTWKYAFPKFVTTDPCPMLVKALVVKPSRQAEGRLDKQIEEDEKLENGILMLPDVSPQTLDEEQRSMVSLILLTLKRYFDKADDYVPLRVVGSATGGTDKYYIIKCIQRQVFGKHNAVQVVMPTGNAAFLVQGTTAHSFLSIPTGGRSCNELTVPAGNVLRKLQDKCKNLAVLIGDERSMVGRTMLGWMEQHMRPKTGSKMLATSRGRRFTLVPCFGHQLLHKYAVQSISKFVCLQSNEVWTRLNGKLACTQVKCTWILPTYVKEISYAPVKNINFSSSKKLKQNLDKAVDDVITTLPNQDKCFTSTKPEASSKFLSPSEDEKNSFYKALNLCKKKPVVLSLVKPYADSFILKSRNILTIPDLFEEKNLTLEYHQLIKICSQTNISISETDINEIEKDTRSQSKGRAFFRHRAGRIGASVSKQASHTNSAQPSQTLVKSICYPDIFQFHSAATDHGCKHEQDAINAFREKMKISHLNYQTIECGMFVHQDFPWLHGTPDFLSVCDCCGEGCGEVKFPFCLDGADFENYATKPNSCLEKVDGEMFLKRQHSYYQVQQQLFATKKGFCDFIVCGFTDTAATFIHERIMPDECHWNHVLPKLSQFWRYCILPEILGRWYTRRSHLLKAVEGCKSLCFCRVETEELTMKCHNEECPISLYHPSCLKISEFPVNWLCPHCQRLPEFKRKSGKVSKKKDHVMHEALKFTTICICKTKANVDDKIIKCQSKECKSRQFFHLSCLGYKRRPNNSKTSWMCNYCRANGTTDQATTPKEDQLLCDIDLDIDITKVAEKKSEKFAPLGTLNDEHYNEIMSPDGWLDCDIIHEIQVKLRNANPNVEGFQRPTLGPSRNFDVVSGEFVQILRTGNSHWVCASSVGCEPGMVNIYDSLYNNVIADEIESQIICLMGPNVYPGLQVVPVQQQQNGSDCGVFAAAFATSILHYIPPETVQFDLSKMRKHLFECLKAGIMEPFPVI